MTRVVDAEFLLDFADLREYMLEAFFPELLGFHFFEVFAECVVLMLA